VETARLERRADEVRTLLAEAIEHLGRLGRDARDLKQALRDLEGPFLLVVAGEFNSGKSSLLNALLGQPLLKEGVTPTTDRIQLLAYGEQIAEEPLGPDAALIRLPAPLLKTVRLVDTPGTNAVIERHQILTERFLPRADLLLFVTSADRPFTESERRFLALVKGFNKPLALVVNKIDLLDEAGRAEVHHFVKAQSERTLGLKVPLFLVSARTGEGVKDLEDYIENLLATDASRIKLGSPLGVLLHHLDAARAELERRVKALDEELERCRALESLWARHERQTREEFEARLAALSEVFRAIERRGERWFDVHVRLSRIFELLNARAVEASFKEEVIADAERQLTNALSASLAWLARRERDLLAAALELLKVEKASAEARGEDDLRAQLEAALRHFSPEAEARLVQGEVEAALKATALAEAGAVGIGAALALFLHGLAADITGLTAGLAAAILGLSVLPRKKAAALRRFRARLAEAEAALKRALMAALEDELERSKARFFSIFSPTCEAQAARRERLAEEQAALAALAQKAQDLLAELQAAKK